ncbi:pantothenate synthetase [Leminorella grimontii]|uniref:Pantothenate synthetase n=1 Tax=Leminorella grimontii TaxID=82981 RepID=A0AAV5N1Y3_9GAMM|nr:pantoate--beta-alanine ligase [Leminorella grimontii]KFC95913.1 pantoate--beta-alanine ligase [Leminorella grimontii ATCC 33999 = DSM 5078]GKX54908.1 pantothenate synthetase [Leminorella grimontii]VFS58143.1 Pantothenate synthetase [Leminorella grimontii]
MINVITSIPELRERVKSWKQEGKSVGLVPTMGFLHEGHQSLMHRAKAENDKVVVSIFVNPMQFGPKEDLASYPRDFERDSQRCAEEGVDVIFHPEATEMYSKNFSSYVDMTGLTEELCGKSRPGHFRGVCTVVSKLFNIVQPNRAYFGEKDAQQLAVIRRMVRDLNIDVSVVGCPIVREADGLAKSSRNSYLDFEQRRAAVCLYRAIQLAQKLVFDGERDGLALASRLKDEIKREPLAKVDYISLVDADSLRPVERIEDRTLCALAVYIGSTRLIDNCTLSV